MTAGIGRQGACPSGRVTRRNERILGAAEEEPSRGVLVLEAPMARTRAHGKGLFHAVHAD